MFSELPLDIISDCELNFTLLTERANCCYKWWWTLSHRLVINNCQSHAHYDYSNPNAYPNGSSKRFEKMLTEQIVVSCGKEIEARPVIWNKIKILWNAQIKENVCLLSSRNSLICVIGEKCFIRSIVKR